ncbi:DUF1488 domain-containing protein [Erwinia persicina]|uniref:DUF1488 domain-containing protein n=1 Tax=Erwinia persicina TaxID=55211 RepID=UPI001C9A6F37|nr:DUF1488 domain-containing protein [Erwinia persicina]MCQ4107473.1 DUF1488 domain-containing protein [Erwinia persicina]QZQ50603.1 DUF1488 domain-containing protein [Erwinia persicina]UTX13323.1 DUF1488 domain-containing protein [Erwinia persicina]
MNQSIQFPEREWWDDAARAVCFTALVDGFQCVCAIGGEVLLRRFATEGDPLSCFRLNRWELEDDAERAIRQQDEDAQGWFWLSSDR